jgi:uncharacterized surface protein with fasciclin (FAS1) repeats
MKVTQKLKRSFLIATIGATFISGLISCKDDPAPTPPPAGSTITDVVVGNADFSVLEAAVIKAGLAETLKGTGPFTVFAPNNAAFTASGITSVDGYSADSLKRILLYHTLAKKLSAADIATGTKTEVTANSPADSIFVTKNGNGVFINGIKVATPDISASNGLIHSIEKVLIPPYRDIVATAIFTKGGDSGLDSLVAAVVKAEGAYPGLIDLLSTETLTVFAPTNKAFKDLLTALGVSNIDQIPVATLYAVLTYHVVGARAFASDLANGPLPMFANGSTTVNITGPTIKGANGVLKLSVGGTADNTSNIIATNILCRNGVVHVIDRVLLP